MDKYQILIIIIPPILTAIGFLIKIMLERRMEKRLKLDKYILDRVQFKLREFYQPILTNLIRENSIFENLITLNNIDTISDEMKLALDGEILAIHLHTQNLIQYYLVDINPPKELLDRLIYYDKHVLIFALLRKYKNVDNTSSLEFPGQYGIPYPHNLQKLIEDKIQNLKEKQNKLIGNWKEYSRGEPH